MTLVDIDKFNIDRGAPMPSTHDVLSRGSIKSKGTNSTNYVSPFTDISILKDARNGQFTVDQVGTFTMLSTVSASSAGVGVFKSSTVNIATIPHNLPYTPGVVGFINEGGTLFPMPSASFAAQGGLVQWSTFRIDADNTNVYIYVDVMVMNGNPSFGGFSFKYYLLQQTAN